LKFETGAFNTMLYLYSLRLENSEDMIFRPNHPTKSSLTVFLFLYLPLRPLDHLKFPYSQHLFSMRFSYSIKLRDNKEYLFSKRLFTYIARQVGALATFAYLSFSCKKIYKLLALLSFFRMT
jgi:hypothetical protein